MQQEIQKTKLYKDTIRKQEKVISRLEKLMETTLKDTQKARNAVIEMEKLKTENSNLQKQLKAQVYGGDNNYSEVEQHKQEVESLQKLVESLKEELKSKRPTTSHGNEWEKEKSELEVMLYRAEKRVESMQLEMTNNAKNFAKEIANLKMQIAEKES